MDDVQLMLDILPAQVRNSISDPDDLVEIILDLGRELELRYNDGAIELNENLIITEDTISYVTKQLSPFGQDNRAGIDGTLHRISRILNRNNECVGLTCRVGKPFYGAVDLIKDLLDDGLNILLLGKPGAGKSTLLRDAARYLSNDFKKVIIVDTSNEIAGDGKTSHPAVGRARRLQVPFDKTQHLIMIEAVENHTPEIIIIDEISTSQETLAARTIAQRGVQLIATAHGKKLEDLISNPPLVDLLGGINTVTLSDELTKQRGLPNKTVQERKTEPTFDVVVEIVSFDEIIVHTDIRGATDALLSGGECRGEMRRVIDGKVRILAPSKIALPLSALIIERRNTSYEKPRRHKR